MGERMTTEEQAAMDDLKDKVALMFDECKEAAMGHLDKLGVKIVQPHMKEGLSWLVPKTFMRAEALDIDHQHKHHNPDNRKKQDKEARRFYALM